MKDIAVFTIASKNYISYARVLMKSFLSFHSDCDCFVLLVDKIEDYFDPSKEVFHTVEIEQLDFTERERFIFKYSIMELNTAVKPFFFDHLFRKFNYGKVIYFDPDILILKDLRALFEILDSHSIVITPHCTSPIPDDGKQLSEIDIMRAGCYNLGFIALSKYEGVRGFLKWWQDRLYKYCYSAPEMGLFVDQKWIDLVPALYDGVHILKHPGYNVAYWNLHERILEVADGQYRVNGKPLTFFHFSGIDMNNFGRISKYQNRYRLCDIENLKELFTEYSDMVISADYHKTKRWPYFYGYFDNGVRIPDIARRLYSSHADQRSFGNPFETAKNKSFFKWLNLPVSKDSRLTNLLHYIYETRPDLREVFPRIRGKDAKSFAHWALSGVPREYGLEEAFIKPLREKMTEIDVSAKMVPQKKKVTVKELLWEYGTQYASLIKSVPLVRNIAEKMYFKLARERRAGSVLYRTFPVSAPDKPVHSASRDKPFSADEMGINIAGYIDTESGVGGSGKGDDKKYQKVGDQVRA